MKFIETKIQDCKIIFDDRHYDDRGYFQELYQKEKYSDFGILDEWNQVNWSLSNKNVLRGIHLAKYAKLVTCVSGEIWDLVIDLRSNSPTFLNWIGIELNSNKSTQVYVPAGCGHGFVAFQDNTSVVYMQSGMFSKQGEFTLKYDDINLKINWPGENHIISDRDKNAYSLEMYQKSDYLK